MATTTTTTTTTILTILIIIITKVVIIIIIIMPNYAILSYDNFQATRELDAAQTIYETINNELFEELPVIYNRSVSLS